VRFDHPAGRVLDWDCENGPGFYWYDGKATSLLHTVSAAWVDTPEEVTSWTTRWRPPRGLVVEDLSRLRKMIESAGAVTGHNIVRHDIPLLNSHFDRLDQPRIEWPHVIDTMSLIRNGMGMSRSQENLLAMYELNREKMTVPLATWEKAWRGSVKESRIVVERCETDVLGHIELYKKLIERES
jgi:hypothetical protein